MHFKLPKDFKDKLKKMFTFNSCSEGNIIYVQFFSRYIMPTALGTVNSNTIRVEDNIKINEI